jgi:hypothetical protein
MEGMEGGRAGDNGGGKAVLQSRQICRTRRLG